jgi:hypothetical protein
LHVRLPGPIFALLKNKKVISFFLVLVLSIQLLPLKQMIGWMISDQLSEEIVHSTDEGKSNPGLDEVHKHFPGSQNGLPGIPVQCGSGSIHHDAEALIARHADDIPTPPPNS